MTEQKDMADAPPMGGVIRLDVSNKEDLIKLVTTGLIWKTRFVQRGLDAIEKGWVPMEDALPNMPADLRAQVEKA